MPKIDVDGIGVAYELIGDGKKAAVITPGGRFSKDTPGVRELALKLAEGGLRVLIWDRPNCGESDLAFRGKSESIQNADTLAGLVRDDRFTLLTCDPGPEIAALHDRQVVILESADWKEWLAADVPRPELLRPLAPGRIEVAQAS